MFWGLIMEPSKRYVQTVSKSFHISMAALDASASGDEPTQVMVGYKGRNYLMCTLQKGENIQCQLDINFGTGDKISFATNGNSHVHLTGYLIDDYDDLDDEEEEDADEEVEAGQRSKLKRGLKMDNGTGGKKMKTLEMLEAVNSQESDDDDSDVNFSSLMEDDDDVEEEEDDENEGEDNDAEEDDDEEDDEDEEVDEEESEDDEDEDVSSMSEDDEEMEETKPTVNGTPISKKNKSQLDTPKEKPNKEKQKTLKSEKKAQQNQQKQEKTPNQQKQKPKETPQKRTVEGGLIIEDLKDGNGPVAKPGKVCQVYYEGRLKSNNKVFDSTNKGAGFKFRLGKQEVIKGWDIGINGMKVGGKRKIICPPHMAYGQKGSPPAIPPNSTLIFTVELKNVL